MSLKKKLDSLVRKALYEFDLLEGPTSSRHSEVVTVAVALSGGKDSLTLLRILQEISGKGFPTFNLLPIYIAGEYSCGPGITESYLKKLCHDWDLPLEVVVSEQKFEKLECYRCSRERRSLLFSKAKELGADIVAFGHHKDDAVETLLLNLLHKAEFAGLLPKLTMSHFGVTIIRPLYFVSEDLTKSFAEQQGFARITCQCPVGQTSKRLETKKLLETLELSFPNAKENLFLAAKNYGSQKAATLRSPFQIFAAN